MSAVLCNERASAPGSAKCRAAQSFVKNLRHIVGGAQILLADQ
jgi:hypothetical protein